MLEDLDWASDEVLEDCLGAVRALRPQAHLLRNQSLLLQPQNHLLPPTADFPGPSLADLQPSGCSDAVDRAEVVAALLRLLRLLLPLLKECKRMNGVSLPLLAMLRLSDFQSAWIGPLLEPTALQMLLESVCLCPISITQLSITSPLVPVCSASPAASAPSSSTLLCSQTRECQAAWWPPFYAFTRGIWHPHRPCSDVISA